MNVSTVFDAQGNYSAAALSWSVVTDKIKLEYDTNRLLETVDRMPVNVMMCDPKTFDITYANQSTVRTLSSLEHLIPIKANALVGSSVDVFHKNPGHQRAIIGDPSRLPFKTQIKLGDESLNLNVDAIIDKDGNYISCLLTWDVVTAQVGVELAVNETVSAVSIEATSLKSNATLLEDNSARSKELAAEVAAAAAAAAAEQTATATEDIKNQVNAIQTETKNVVEALEVITSTVSNLSGISTGIASAVEEQDAATREISSNVQQAASGAQQVSTKIVDVRAAAESTEQAAVHITSASVNLEGLANSLDAEIKRMAT